MSMGLKGKQVGPKKTIKKLFTPGEDRKDFGRREGNVEEETDGCIGQPVPQHLGKQHQVVVVYPD
jgi:hypothetical protein